MNTFPHCKNSLSRLFSENWISFTYTNNHRGTRVLVIPWQYLAFREIEIGGENELTHKIFMIMCFYLQQLSCKYYRITFPYLFLIFSCRLYNWKFDTILFIRKLLYGRHYFNLIDSRFITDATYFQLLRPFLVYPFSGLFFLLFSSTYNLFFYYLIC